MDYRRQAAALSSYAVLWQAGGDKQPPAGSNSIRLGCGCMAAKAARRCGSRFPTRRSPRLRATRRRTSAPGGAIRIETRSAEPLLLASIAGIGVLGEILETLRVATGG